LSSKKKQQKIRQKISILQMAIGKHKKLTNPLLQKLLPTTNNIQKNSNKPPARTRIKEKIQKLSKPNR